MRKLVLGIADGIMKVDGKVIYEAKGLRVGLFIDAATALHPEYRRACFGLRLLSRFRMKRVVVSGLGIVSSIGNNASEVTQSLRDAKSGIVAAEDYIRLGFQHLRCMAA